MYTIVNMGVVWMVKDTNILIESISNISLVNWMLTLGLIFLLKKGMYIVYALFEFIL